MAQSAEHILGKDEVAGSIPAISSREKPPNMVVFLIFDTNIKFQGRTHKYNCTQFSKTANFSKNETEVKLFPEFIICHSLAFQFAIYINEMSIFFFYTELTTETHSHSGWVFIFR